MSHYKVKQSRYKPVGGGAEVSRKLTFPDFVTTTQDGGRFSTLSTGRLHPQEIFLVLVSVMVWVDPRTIVRSEDFMSMKNPLTLAGIEPSTFRFVAQPLNHCATAVLNVPLYLLQINVEGKGISPLFLNLGTEYMHHAPAVLPSVMPSTTSGTEHWVFPERLWKFWEKIKCWHTLGFTPRTVHPLAQSIHPLRYDGSIQHWLQACWNAKLIIQQEIQSTVALICWPLELCKLEVSLLYIYIHFVDRASYCNPTNLTHNYFLKFVYLFKFSTCFEQTCALHQERQFYQYDHWYMSLYVGDIYQGSYWYNWVSWWRALRC